MSGTSKYGFPLKDDEGIQAAAEQPVVDPPVDLVPLADELNPKIQDILLDFFTSYIGLPAPRMSYSPHPHPDSNMKGPEWGAMTEDKEYYVILELAQEGHFKVLRMSGPATWPVITDGTEEHPLEQLGSVLKDQTGVSCEVNIRADPDTSPLSTDGGPSMGIDTQV